MPINNVCIQKRRLRELAKLIHKHTQYESLTPSSPDAYKQFNFIVPELSIKLAEDLVKDGFEIAWVSPRRDKILVSVWMGVCPEKADRTDKPYILKGYKTQVEIDKHFWLDAYQRRRDECDRLEAELKSKEQSIQQLCKRVVDLKNEKEEITSGLNMFRLFFDTVEVINK